MQQEFDHLGFRGDRAAACVGARQDATGFGHHRLRLPEEANLLLKFRLPAAAGQDLPLHPLDLLVEPQRPVGHVELLHDPAHAFGKPLLRAGEPVGTGLEGLGIERRPHLLRNAGLLAKIRFGLQDQHRFEHHLGRQALRWGTVATTAIAAAILGRRHQFIGPAVERVGPEFRLGDRRARLTLHVVGELPEAAQQIELLHLVEHGSQRRQWPSLAVGIQIVHDRGEFLPHLVVPLGHGVDLPPQRVALLLLRGLAKRLRHDRRQPLAHLQFAPSRGLQPLHERRALQPRHHIG